MSSKSSNITFDMKFQFSKREQNRSEQILMIMESGALAQHSVSPKAPVKKYQD